MSEIFDPSEWDVVPGLDFTDITYHRRKAGRVARTPSPEWSVWRSTGGAQRLPTAHGGRALPGPRPRADDPDVGVVLITGNGPSPKDGKWAFCSGGDQRIRGRSGYQYAAGETADTVDEARAKAHGGRLHILEVQRLIRTMPKIVIAVVNGWAAGGGHCSTSSAT